MRGTYIINSDSHSQKTGDKTSPVPKTKTIVTSAEEVVLWQLPMLNKASSTLGSMAELNKAMSICHLGSLKSLYTINQLASSTPLRPFSISCYLLWPTHPQTRPTWTLKLSPWPDVPCTSSEFIMSPVLSSFGSGCCLVALLYQGQILWNLLPVEIRWREQQAGCGGLILLVVLTYIPLFISFRWERDADI